MSRVGNVWDNAAMESFYNPHRRHATIGYESPMAFEAKMQLA